LKAAGPSVPIIGVVHCPMVTAFATYAQVISAGRKYNTLTVANSPDVLDLFEGHNVIAVLQGHTHINENVAYKGTQFITGGAVCGNWWRGPRLGTPEGFTVVSLRKGQISTRYETFGFHSVSQQK
jgi:3',5'-cyclic-AMP phosphodiesterase